MEKVLNLHTEHCLDPDEGVKERFPAFTMNN